MKHRRSSNAFECVLDRVSAFLSENGLLGKHIVCAFSGGADSACLLSALLGVREKNGISLSAVHVNHGMRGESSDRDEAFCRAFCEERGIPLLVFRRDVPARVEKTGESPETAAREERYGVFREVLSGEPDAYLATAHNATDNAETVIFREARGTGLRGLAGIPPKRDRIVRPLLSLTREEIRLAVEEAAIPYTEDETNAIDTYSRNYIRHEILPRLEHIRPGAVKSISEMTSHLSEDEAYLCGVAQDLLASPDVRKAIVSAPAPIARRALTILYGRAKKSPDAISARQIDGALAALRGGEKHISFDFPCGVRMTSDGGDVTFREDKEPDVLPTHRNMRIGVNELEGRDACLILDYKPICPGDFIDPNVYNLLIQSELSSDTIIECLTVRQRREGDAYRYHGMTHKVKTMFCDRKLSQNMRRKLPVLCDGRGILWIPGFPPREGDGDERKVFACYCTREAD